MAQAIACRQPDASTTAIHPTQVAAPTSHAVDRNQA
jgi:hypothetical protein